VTAEPNGGFDRPHWRPYSNRPEPKAGEHAERDSKAYEPQQIERRWAKRWAEEKLFRADVNAPGPVFSIVIPPPNVTGSLHIGHMLDHTEIDILTRWRRMQGYNTLYLRARITREFPRSASSCASLRRKGSTTAIWDAKRSSERSGNGRKNPAERLRGRWSSSVRAAIGLANVSHFHQSCHAPSRKSSSAYTKDGLIYRGHYIVNWCPQCRTAISDLETVHEERQGHLWHIRYPIVARTNCCGCDDAARNHARRYRCGRSSERPSLSTPDWQDGSSSADEPRDSDRG